MSKEISSTNYHPRILLRLTEVQHLVGLGRSSIYSMIRAGTFPSPVRLGARAVAWPSDTINSWIDSRLTVSTSKCEGEK